jgi:hypothetical protein
MDSEAAKRETEKKQQVVLQTLKDELERRQKSSTSIVDVLRGFDDVAREEQAKFNFQNPEFTSDWISGRIWHLKEELNKARSESDHANWLASFSARNPLHHATSGWDQYTFSPPTTRSRSSWHKLIRNYSLGREMEDRLFTNGFMPIKAGAAGQALAFLSTVNGVDYRLNPKHRYILADTDYGNAILPPDAPWKNVSMDITVASRYVEDMQFLAKTPSLLFDLGALRAHQLLHGRFPKEPDIMHARVLTRKELETAIGMLIKKAANHERYQVWFRGQPGEYLLPDLRIGSWFKLYPWRQIQDISQVPSLYRNQVQRLSNLRTYCERLLEFQMYYLFIKETLGVGNFATRLPDEEMKEKFPQLWNKDSLKLSMEMRTVDGETIEFHDWDNTYRGLQHALFLQHYGLESNILDLTNDLDIALFFAQKEVIKNRYVDVDSARKRPVIYIFVLDRELDPVVNTSDLLESFDLPRPKRQNCGILAGASLVNKNFYSRFIGLRITLEQRIEMKYQDPEYLFPGPKEDKFLGNLMKFCELQNMSHIKPFVLEE